MPNTDLATLRTRIDRIDRQIIDLLAERFSATHEVGKLKATTGLAAVDPTREAQQKERFRQMAEQTGLNPELVLKVFKVIIDEVVVNHQTTQQSLLSQNRENSRLFKFLEIKPTSSDTQPDTAIVYLHGSGERGDDLSLVTKYGLPAAVTSSRLQVNCPIFCPQLESEAEWAPLRVGHFVRWVKTRYSTVVLMGYSLGASGVCSVVAKMGAVAEAFMAIAGQAPDTIEADPAGVRLLAIQGDQDTWPNTADFVPAIQALGGHAESAVLQGMGHYVSEEAMAHPACQFLLSDLGIRIKTTACR